ncbi:mucin-21-like [Argopecten irradians]|uniref:mucin-21-like n=1 Tax=Argopecten irradians TaxID=31199 RepID=UPI003710C569
MDVRSSLLWSVLAVVILHGQCCLVDKNWSARSTYELLDMADIVVYGLDTEHVERTGVQISTRINNVTDCLFHVYCVLKGNITNKDIVIEHISPLSACSGSSKMLQVGMKKIVGLKMADSGNYKYFEGNALQSSVYESDVDTFRTMDSIVQISKWRSPLGAEEGSCQAATKNMTISNENMTANDIIAAKSSSQATEPTTIQATTIATDVLSTKISSQAKDTTTMKPTSVPMETETTLQPADTATMKSTSVVTATEGSSQTTKPTTMKSTTTEAKGSGAIVGASRNSAVCGRGFDKHVYLMFALVFVIINKW